MEAEGAKSWNSIPIWNGRPEAFSHFIHEVKWTLSSSKKEERALLAARIVRKALQTGEPTLVQLMYKLEPDEFKGEEDVQKLIRYLEESPLNRQALPDAGNKIGSYYRRLQRRPQESVPAFLIREDKVHDEMIKALQRLLREKELDFDGYDMTLDELKLFCGINPGESLFFGHDDPGEDEEREDASSQRTATPSREGVPLSSRQSSTTAQEKPPHKGKDVIERLMAKGLIPLAALDVIRGWMILEMATSTEEDRRLIRAATRNKLGYFDIRSALLSMYEEKVGRTSFGGKGHKGGLYQLEEEWMREDEGGDQEEAVNQLLKEQDEAERQHMELQSLAAESGRNLAEARKAVAQAARDRGWNQPPQQRQVKYTSTYPGKGHKGKPSFGAGFGKGKINYQEDLAWMKGQPPFGSKGKFGKGKFGNQKGKTSSKGKDLHFSYDHSMSNGRRRTKKRHLVLDFLEDVYIADTKDSHAPSKDYENDKKKPSQPHVRRSQPQRVFVADKESRSETEPNQPQSASENHFAEVHDLWMHGGSFEVSCSEEIFTADLVHDTSIGDSYSDDLLEEEVQQFADHFNISEGEVAFLLNRSSCEQVQAPTGRRVRFADLEDERPVEGRDEEDDERSDGRTAQGDVRGDRRKQQWLSSSKGQSFSQEEDTEDPVRLYKSDWGRPSRPKKREDNLAVLWRSQGGGNGQQQVGPLDGVCKMCTPGSVRTGSGSTCSIHEARSSHERARSFAQPEDSRLDRGGCHGTSGEGFDRGGEQTKDPVRQEEDPRGSKSISKDGINAWEEEEERPKEWGGDGRDFGRGELLGGGIATGEEVMPLPGAQHDMHHEDDAGIDARHRRLKGAEKMQLLRAAEEFNGGAILASLHEVGNPMTVWEVCCRSISTLSEECKRLGLTAIRKNLENGIDIEKEPTIVRLLEDQEKEKPYRAWWSLRCTEWSSIQNLNQRSQQQIEALRKKRQRGRRGVKYALATIEMMLDKDTRLKFYWEWPKGAYQGWNLEDMKNFQRRMRERGVRLFFTEIDGCMLGVVAPSGEPLMKQWIVMNNDPDFHQHCQVLCDKSHVHREGGIVGIGSAAVEATGFYPQKMALMIARRWKSQFEQVKQKNYHVDLEQVMSIMDNFVTDYEGQTNEEKESGSGEAEKTEDENVTKEVREKGEALLHRLHKASGHPTNRALARLCRDRGLPGWMVRMALSLKCPACLSNQRGEQMIIPYSLGARPGPWQFLSADVTDMVFPSHRCKVRFLVITCMVMKFVAIKMVWKGQVGEAGTDPGKVLAEAFIDVWLAHRPRPQWILVDPQCSLSSGTFVAFMQLTGIGVSVTPGEAHWQQGTIESLIRVLKGTMRRLRDEHPEIDPQTCANLAVNAHNHQHKSGGYTPVQWAYGYDPNMQSEEITPVEFNAHQPHFPFSFWQVQKLRREAEETWRTEQAKEAWTRLTNASSRSTRTFQVGEWVCIWRTAIWRTRKKSINPEPRFVGPGRIALVEPAVIAENKPAVYWVLMGTQIWRCAPEQIRKASEQELTIEEALRGKKMSIPVTDLLKQASKVIDVTKEPHYPVGETSLPSEPGPSGVQAEDERLGRAQPQEEWHQDQEAVSDRWRSRRPKRSRGPETVAETTWRWKQLVSTNENRRREGLPPIMELPPLPDTDDSMCLEKEERRTSPEVFQLDGEMDLHVAEEAYEDLMQQIGDLEKTLKAVDRRMRLREEITQEKKEEERLFRMMMKACEKGEEVCEIEVEVDDHRQLLTSGAIYMKQMMASAKEVNFRNLTPEDKALIEEAMSRELSEVLRSQALKLIKDKIPEEEVHRRCIPMRWLLTWKPLDEPKDPKTEEKPGVLRSDGRSKAKARLVMIGYKHPDLAQRDPRTGRALLQTSSPTLSRMGRNLLLQAAALDNHTLESADARSAFLQAEQGIGKTRLFTRAVPEISHAFGVPPGTALEVVGAIYGLTNAPRIFWLDADNKIQALGGVPHGIDRCVWTFKNRAGTVCGRIGAHVDDFLIAGNMADEDWVAIRAKIKAMYQWSPWQKGSFVFAGVQLCQLQDFSITIGQEHFCNDLTPVAIDNERSRPKDDKLTQKELSQCRGLIMKAQWRAIQTAPQYCCRIGLAASSLTKGTLDVLKEANSIVKELKKTSQDGLVFHSFPEEKLSWRSVTFIHFGDAARGNRQDGGDTGGFISGIASPKILEGQEAKFSVLDYRSWKLDRPVRGSNGSEAQALYVTEDAGWKLRVCWSLLYGEELRRGEADRLASLAESLLVMDSRGCYDALSNSDSPLLGMNNAKTGVELMSVQRGIREGTNCHPTWTPSDMNLSDCMTKVTTEAFKVWALWQSRKSWIVKFNDEFISARRQQKLRRQQGKPQHALLEPLQEEAVVEENEDSWMDHPR
eukprot:symbB.v1.2.024989.t1/scaffold2394.1/size82379/5